MKRSVIWVLASVFLVLGLILGSFGCAAPAPSPTPTPTPSPTTEWKPTGLVGVAGGSTAAVGFATAVGLTGGITDVTGVQFRVVPGDTTVDRAKLLREKTVDLGVFTAGDVLFDLKGIYDLKEWGPQSVRSVWMGGSFVGGWATRANSGIKTVADIKGKKYPTYPGYPMVNQYAEAILAFANLTWNDVVATPVANYAAGMTAVLQGAVDIAFFGATTPNAQELAASAYGIYWVPLPKADKEAWARLLKVAPYWYQVSATYGAGISKEKPVEIWAYDTFVVAYDWTDANLVYWFTKQTHKNYDVIKNKHAALPEWTIDKAMSLDMMWVPYHEASIKYFKEIGKWTADHDKLQKSLLDMYK